MSTVPYYRLRYRNNRTKPSVIHDLPGRQCPTTACGIVTSVHPYHQHHLGVDSALLPLAVS